MESPADMNHRLSVGGKETRFPGAFSLLHQTVRGSINYMAKKSVASDCARVVRKTRFPEAFSLLHQTVCG